MWSWAPRATTEAMVRTAIIGMALLLGAEAHAQNITEAEYWVDLDAGFGASTSITVLPMGSDVNGSVPIPTAGLTPGLHTISIRTKDATGRWSHTNHFPLYVEADEPTNANIAQTYYFLNADPGWEAGDDAGLSESPNVSDVVDLDLSLAHEGLNTLFIRSRDASGRWSLTNHVPLYVQDTLAGDIRRVEYFWGSDPGFGGAADSILAEPGADLPDLELMASVPLDAGPLVDTLLLRSVDQYGRWSHTNHLVVNVSGVSVEDLGTLGISVYPNPFQDAFEVRTNDGRPVRVVVHDPSGKQVCDRLLTGPTRIDLSGTADGSYTVSFWKELHTIHRVTMVKQ